MSFWMGICNGETENTGIEVLGLLDIGAVKSDMTKSLTANIFHPPTVSKLVISSLSRNWKIDQVDVPI